MVEGRRRRRTVRRMAGRGGSGSRMVLLDARSLWLITTLLRRACVDGREGRGEAKKQPTLKEGATTARLACVLRMMVVCVWGVCELRVGVVLVTKGSRQGKGLGFW